MTNSPRKPEPGAWKKADRIAAYGGTFDPIHYGHIEIARLAVRRFGLDELLLIPAYRPPHKRLDAITGASHRYEMAKLAVAGEPRITVSRLELDAPERPYTVQTMARLRAEYGLHAKLFFVMGADSFQDIPKWREWERLMANVNLIVVTRPGHAVTADHLPAEARARVVDARDTDVGDTGARKTKDALQLIREGEECFIYVVDEVYLDISSTEIRRRVRDGEGLEGLTPPEVAAYIERHNLYRHDL
jgi:nicotinate-nucleotide adenylyltransferase